MVRSAKRCLTDIRTGFRRFGNAGMGGVSLPSFLFGAASASGICWLVQAGDSPPPTAMVLLFIAVLNTGWLVVRLGSPTAQKPSPQNRDEDAPIAGDGPDVASQPQEPPATAKVLQAPPSASQDGTPGWKTTLGEPPHIAHLQDRFHDRCRTVADRADLAPREREILVLLARGRNTKYIQDNLVIAASTVKSHTYRIYQKLGVHSRQELIDEVEAAQGKEEQTGAETGDGKIYAFRTGRRECI